jgi:hypothetical protein
MRLGTKRLKLISDKLLSNGAFKFNLRRYNVVLKGSFNVLVKVVPATLNPKP